MPAAPDSILKDLVTALVTKADEGSKEAKSLLETLLGSIKDSIVPPTEKK